MRREELTFDVVDDLVSAQLRGRLGRMAPDIHYAPSAIGPLIELVFESTDGRFGPLLVLPWVDHLTQNDLRAALRGATNMWLDPPRRRGFMRTVFNPLDAEDDIARNPFLMAARVAAEAGGLPGPLALTLAAAIQELESNIHEHSERPESGLLVFQARQNGFEFVAADAGCGVLAT